MKIEKVYTTILVLVSGILIISLVLSLTQLIYLSLGILLVSSINESLASSIANLWLKFGNIIGAINSKIILSVFFVSIIIPLSIAKRIFVSKEKTDKKTNWVNVNERTNFNNPW